MALSRQQKLIRDQALRIQRAMVEVARAVAQGHVVDRGAVKERLRARERAVAEHGRAIDRGRGAGEKRLRARDKRLRARRKRERRCAAWEEPIYAWTRSTRVELDVRGFTTVSEVLSNALGLEPVARGRRRSRRRGWIERSGWKRSDEMLVSAILTDRLGWVKGKRRRGPLGKLVLPYYPPPSVQTKDGR